MTKRVMRQSLVWALACAMSAGALAGCTTGAAELQRAQHILTDEVPDDASAKQVLAYLDKRRIEHSPYQDYRIQAVIRERPSPYLFVRNYTAEYRFDQHNNLVEKTVAIKYGVF